jgi:hypothetical protein
MKTDTYCCIWCHKALTKEETYVNERTGSIVCDQHRGLGIVLNQWNKPCKRRHSVEIAQESEKK